jgi:signal transduction histidine kinase
VRERDGGLDVEVTDNGCGGADASKGTGLHGLEERLRALDGTLAVESEAGKGTRLLARIPLAAEEVDDGSKPADEE